jgi:tetratricopeptide (TPR) repeat protein
MEKITPSPENGKGAGHRKRRVTLGLAALLASTLGLGAYFWFRPSVPRPPALDLAGADPGVVEAIEAASKTVDESPRSATAWGRLGMVLLAHHLGDEACFCFAQAERLDPREPRWPYYQGIKLLMGDPDAAIPKLQQAVELCADRTTVPRLRLGELLLEQGRPEEAADQFRRVLALEPDNPRANLGLGRVTYARGIPRDSLAPLEKAAANRFTAKAAHTLLGAIHERRGDKTAVDQELRVVQNLPDDPVWPDPFMEEVEQLQRGRQARFKRVDQLLAQGREREAIALLQEMVRDYPDSDRAWLWLGRALVQAEEFARAEQALRVALKRKPDLIEAHFYLGVVLFEQGNPHAAAGSFRKATELKPDHAVAHYNLGHCRLREGDREGALRSFRTAVECKPHYAEAHANAGELLLQDGRRTEALVHLRYAAQLNPADQKTRNLLQQVQSQVPLPEGR